MTLCAVFIAMLFECRQIQGPVTYDPETQTIHAGTFSATIQRAEIQPFASPVWVALDNPIVFKGSFE